MPDAGWTLSEYQLDEKKHRLLVAAASLTAEPQALGARVQYLWLMDSGAQAQQSLRGMWDLPGPGTEPVSSELAGGFSIPELPGKSLVISSILAGQKN